MQKLKCDSKTRTHVTSSFKFNDRVKIIPLGVEGRVVSFWLKEEDYLMIEVRYFINNEKKIEYFYEDELEVVKEQKTGFSMRIN